MRRTISGAQLLTLKQDLMQLGDGWNDCLGEIPKTGVVAIWGHSGNGKSGAAMSLCKELGAYGKVLYVASEEHCTPIRHGVAPHQVPGLP